jgi:rare lipoprotein A
MAHCKSPSGSALLLTCLLTILSGCVSKMPTLQQPHTHTKQTKSSYVVFGQTYQVMPDSMGYMDIGIASWYGRKFHGRQTSSGDRYNMHALTAAHRSLPLPTYVRVTNLDNRRSIVVEVNDRGPFHDDRLIDLSLRAAQVLGFSDAGTATVVVEAIDQINYPDMVTSSGAASASGSVYYLQLGAFYGREGAEALMQDVEQLMDDHAYPKISVRILESEKESSILHKVWMGPLSSVQEERELVLLVEDAELGTPMRIEVGEQY